MSNNFWAELAIQMFASVLTGLVVAYFVVGYVKNGFKKHERDFHGQQDQPDRPFQE